MNNFFTRILSGIGLISISLLLVFYGPLGLLLFAAIVLVFGLWEWNKLMAVDNLKVILLSLLSGIILLVTSFYFLHFILLSGILGFFTLCIYLMDKKRWKPFLFGQLYLTVPLIFLQLIPFNYTFLDLSFTQKSQLYNPYLPFMLFVLVWSSDSWAYVFGKLFGKHKLAPSISPGKTWEGFIGGTLMTAISGYVYCLLVLKPESSHYYSSNFHNFTLEKAALLGFLVSIFGTLGDLFESSLKRKANVKDSGNIIPGHGGILDRYDALLFVIVVQFVISYLW